MVVLINSFQMRYFGYLYLLSMVHKLDLPRPRFHENQELKLRYISAESPCVGRIDKDPILLETERETTMGKDNEIIQWL